MPIRTLADTASSAGDIAETISPTRLAAWGAALSLYLLPAIIGLGRRHPHLWSIFAVNSLLGWTIIGWIGALFWSLVSPVRIESHAARSTGLRCAHCGAAIHSHVARGLKCARCGAEAPSDARYCPQCGSAGLS